MFVCVHPFMCDAVCICICECGCVYVHVCTCLCACVHMSVCMCAHDLLVSAQKLEDRHAVCCVCVCMCLHMNVCSAHCVHIYVVCTWHVFIVWVLLGSPVV